MLKFRINSPSTSFNFVYKLSCFQHRPIWEFKARTRHRLGRGIGSSYGSSLPFVRFHRGFRQLFQAVQCAFPTLRLVRGCLRYCDKSWLYPSFENSNELKSATFQKPSNGIKVTKIGVPQCSSNVPTRFSDLWLTFVYFFWRSYHDGGWDDVLGLCSRRSGPSGLLVQDDIYDQFNSSTSITYCSHSRTDFRWVYFTKSFIQLISNPNVIFLKWVKVEKHTFNKETLFCSK